jgi:hypothetical protein
MPIRQAVAAAIARRGESKRVGIRYNSFAWFALPSFVLSLFDAQSVPLPFAISLRDYSVLELDRRLGDAAECFLPNGEC